MKASLCYLTQPAPGVFVLILQYPDIVVHGLHQLIRVEISRDQLGGLVADGAAMALRSSFSETAE